MKKGIAKKLLCYVALAGALVLGKGAVVNAATTTAEDVTEEAELSEVDYAIGMNFYVDNYGGEYTGINFSGNAPYYKLFINNVLFRSGKGNEWGGYFSSYDSISIKFGPKYTFRAEVYDDTNKLVQSQTTTVKIDFPTFSEAGRANVEGTTYYDSEGHTTGFKKPYVSLRIPVSNYRSQKYEIYRAEGKATNAYKMVGTTYAYGDIYYSDYTVEPGKKYFYKACPVSETDEFVPSVIRGAMSSVVPVTIGGPSAEAYLDYTVDGINIGMWNTSYTSHFEIYRSTNAKKGYKLIATTSDTGYLDKDVKAGSTYYYKVKPIYYDIQTKKAYKGKFTEVMGAKLIIGYIYAEAKQTSNTSVALSWNKVAGADSYEIWMKNNSYAGDGFKKIASSSGTKYNARGLSKTDRYSFIIKAVKKSGGVEKYFTSDTRTVNMGFHGIDYAYVLNKKSKLSKDGKTITITSTVTWDRVFGANGYIVEAYDNSKNSMVTLKKIKKNSIVKFKINNVVTKNGNAKYDYIRITPYKGSETKSGATEYSIRYLPAVKGLKIKKKTASSAVVSWKKVSGAKVYYIYRNAPTGESVCIGNTPNASFVDNYFTPGVNYTYSVQASNNDFNLYDGDPAYNSYNHVLVAPKVKSVVNVSGKSAKVTWNKAAYATKYVIYRSTSKKGTYKKVATVSSDKTSYVDKKLKKGKTYYYKITVEAVNDAGIKVTSKASNVKSVKIKK